MGIVVGFRSRPPRNIIRADQIRLDVSDVSAASTLPISRPNLLRYKHGGFVLQLFPAVVLRRDAGPPLLPKRRSSVVVEVIVCGTATGGSAFTCKGSGDSHFVAAGWYYF